MWSTFALYALLVFLILDPVASFYVNHDSLQGLDMLIQYWELLEITRYY